MQAGLMRKRITLQQRVASVDSFNQQILSWNTIAIFWAEIEFVSGAQLARSQSIYNMTSHHIVTRYQPLFANVKKVGSYRALYDDRVFDIGASLNDAERNRSITLLCSEGLNDGQ